jgi:hypothetical protein
MRVVLDTPLTLYRSVISRDAYQAEVTSLEVVLDPLFAEKKDLVGRELFEAQKLRYEEPRKYIVLFNNSIKPGMFIEDGSDRFVILSIERTPPIWMTLLVTRRRDTEVSS